MKAKTKIIAEKTAEQAAAMTGQHPISLPHELYEPMLLAFQQHYPGVVDPQSRAALLCAFLRGVEETLETIE